MKWNEKLTELGFELIEFRDYYNIPCWLQQSSLAPSNAIWLGTNKDGAHLDSERVVKLIEYLQRWLDTGSFFEDGTPTPEDRQ